jgi:DNA-binding transcriptional LysR family regulator
MVAALQDSADVRWDDLRLFLALYRARTLAAAGARLGVDGSTMSRRLAALEELLGARLFDRTREGLVPTHAAELVAVGAEEMEAGHQRLLREASAFETEAEGLVRLSVPPGVADVFIGPALVRLRERHPRIRIELDASVRVVDLTRREADLALRTIRPRGGDLVMTRLTTSRWLPMTSPAYAKELGRLARWEDARWIQWADDLASIPAAQWVSRHVKAEPVLKTSHFATQLSAIESGLGVALVAEQYAMTCPIVPLRLAPALAKGAEWPVDDLWLVGHRALRGVPRVDAVWTFILDELGAK